MARKNNKKKRIPKERNPAVLPARKRKAGPMKSRSQKRKNRNSWRKELELIEEV